MFKRENESMHMKDSPYSQNQKTPAACAINARDVFYENGNFALTHGDVLCQDVIQARLYGHAGNPLIIIPGGISASRFIADKNPSHTQTTGQNWWADIVKPGGAIDLNVYQVLGIDLAPTGQNTNTRLTITTHDQARRLHTLLTHMGITKAHAIIGTSYGGMVAMAFAQTYHEMVDKQCILGAAHRPHQMGVAWRGIERRIVEMASRLGDAKEGLKLARELAMTTYRSPKEFAKRFSPTPTTHHPVNFEVDSYLKACGERYLDVIAVNRFLALSESIDLHHINPQSITTPSLLIATHSDQLAPVSEISLMHQNLGASAHLATIHSLYGHDSFLKETALLSPLLQNFVDKPIIDNKSIGYE